VNTEGAAIIANALQFPRVLVLLYLLNYELALASQWVLFAMTAAGTLLALMYWRARGSEHRQEALIRNPFSLAPALKFGLFLTAILVVSKAALAEFGTGSIQWIAGIAGLADVDAVLLPVTELFGQGAISMTTASGSVLLALLANGITKSVIAAAAGTRYFSVRLLGAFAGMFAAGFAAWWIQANLA
jgi:uncharacterized membrane protein (DUF4010 family)